MASPLQNGRTDSRQKRDDDPGDEGFDDQDGQVRDEGVLGRLVKPIAGAGSADTYRIDEADPQ